MAGQQSILAHPVALVVVTSTAAVVTAAGQQGIEQVWGQGWSWVGFSKDVLANGVIAVVLAVVASALQRAQARVQADQDRAKDIRTARARLRGYTAARLVVSTWNPPPARAADGGSGGEVTPDEVAAAATAWAASWQSLADDLGRLDELDEQRRDGRPDEREEATTEAFLLMAQLGNRLQLYASEGARHRRLLYLQWAGDDLAASMAADYPWSVAVNRLRNAAIEMIGWVHRVDSVIVEQLLVLPATHLGFDQKGTSEKRRDLRVALPDPAAASDPLYLLIAHVNRATGTVTPETRAGVWDLLDRGVRRCVHGLRFELLAAVECAHATVNFIAALSDEATGQPEQPDTTEVRSPASAR